MPVRKQAVQALAEALDGGVSFNSIEQTARVGGVGGETMSMDAYEDRYDTVYVKLVDSIDWERVMLEATQRHLQLDHEISDYYGMVCPECVGEALLVLKGGGWQDWIKEPMAPRELRVLDSDHTEEGAKA